MTTNNPDPLEEDIARTLSCHLWATIVADNNDDCDEFDAMPDYIKDIYRRAAAAIIAQHYAPVIAENERLRAENYKTFTDGMEAAAQICGSLAETTYDDTDAFEAATGCEAEIMKVVKQQRKEQALGAKP